MANKNKRISQETFDETVKENMDDFEMSREAAIADASEQFKMQVRTPSSLESVSRRVHALCRGQKRTTHERTRSPPSREAGIVSQRSLCVGTLTPVTHADRASS